MEYYAILFNFDILMSKDYVLDKLFNDEIFLLNRNFFRLSLLDTFKWLEIWLSEINKKKYLKT